MDAKTYVYAYLFLSVLYAAGCLQFVNVLGSTGALARKLRAPVDDPPALDSDASVETSRTAIRAVLGVDSAAFACTVLPVAYLGVTGLLGNTLSRNTAAASSINTLWLLATVALVAAHMFFTVRVVGLNGQLKALEPGVLSERFVSRHTSVFAYYRTILLVVTLLNVANTVYLLANLSGITDLPYVI
jgi:hypothetical protein